MKLFTNIYTGFVNVSLLLLIFGLFLFNKNYEKIQVAGDSMYPSYTDHESLLVRKTEELLYDDVVVMKAPDLEPFASTSIKDIIFNVTPIKYIIVKVIIIDIGIEIAIIETVLKFHK